MFHSHYSFKWLIYEVIVLFVAQYAMKEIIPTSLLRNAIIHLVSYFLNI
jgi:hypothetical protein